MNNELGPFVTLFNIYGYRTRYIKMEQNIAERYIGSDPFLYLK